MGCIKYLLVVFNGLFLVSYVFILIVITVSLKIKPKNIFENRSLTITFYAESVLYTNFSHIHVICIII